MVIKNYAIRAICNGKLHWVSKPQLTLGFTLTPKFDHSCILDKEWAYNFMNRPGGIDPGYKLCTVISTVVMMKGK